MKPDAFFFPWWPTPFRNTVLSSIEHAAIARLYTKKGLALKPEEVRVVFAMAMERKASGRDDGR